MRQIILDTETTGLNPKSGDRIIEIGCVEMVNRRLTGNNFHYYINPERDSDPGALAVHGLTTEFLSDKPKFADIADTLCEFVQDAEIIIHNAPFDIGFLDAEFERVGKSGFAAYVRRVVDTLVQAKELFPGKRNSLDALCDRYGVSNAHRTLHGALLDAELLAEVYLAMTRGQDSLSMDLQGNGDEDDTRGVGLPIADMLILPPTADELAEHELLLKGLEKDAKGAVVWRDLGTTS
ncbi:MAG: DNA polymerase III subunit epsilon [Betaproteobacteria bacterium]|nr:DNA polymerase III subunit epsilon [Betaproteobacteria bacterium]